MWKRSLDFTAAAIGLMLLLPLLLVVTCLIVLVDGFPIFYSQIRVGRWGKTFRIHKFRTMTNSLVSGGQITVGQDARITSLGKLLRKTKFDELPQLINVLKGEMSLVGPRPEVQRYVSLYSSDMKEVLNYRPGITDLASIVYRGESDLLGRANDPENFYVAQIMPHKIEINLNYQKRAGLISDIGIVAKTFLVPIGWMSTELKPRSPDL